MQGNCILEFAETSEGSNDWRLTAWRDFTHPVGGVMGGEGTETTDYYSWGVTKLLGAEGIDPPN